MMKLHLLIVMSIGVLLLSCNPKTELTEAEKNLVETEIEEFLNSFDSAAMVTNVDKYFAHFIDNKELTIASQGYLMKNSQAVRDTIDKHFSAMEKQEIQTIDESFYVVNSAAVVVSTSKVTTITFKNGYVVNFPYALTMLIVKREGKWEIVHYHN